MAARATCDIHDTTHADISEQATKETPFVGKPLRPIDHCLIDVRHIVEYISAHVAAVLFDVVTWLAKGAVVCGDAMTRMRCTPQIVRPVNSNRPLIPANGNAASVKSDNVWLVTRSVQPASRNVYGPQRPLSR